VTYGGTVLFSHSQSMSVIGCGACPALKQAVQQSYCGDHTHQLASLIHAIQPRKYESMGWQPRQPCDPSSYTPAMMVVLLSLLTPASEFSLRIVHFLRVYCR
jgi:hypothetical protein